MPHSSPSLSPLLFQSPDENEDTAAFVSILGAPNFGVCFMVMAWVAFLTICCSQSKRLNITIARARTSLSTIEMMIIVKILWNSVLPSNPLRTLFDALTQFG